MSRETMFRASEFRTFGRCNWKWWMDWREGYTPKSRPLGALWFGTGIHLALAKWYCGPGIKRGAEPEETWAEYAGDALAYVRTTSPDDGTMVVYEDAVALGAEMLRGYRELYKRDDHMDVICPERTFSIPVPYPKGQKIWELPKGAMLGILAGTFDLAWRDLRTHRGQILLEEHKTAKAVSTRHLNLDPQGGTYWAVATETLRAMGAIGRDEWLAGIEYNFLKKAMPDLRPKDADGYATNKPSKADYIAALHGDGLVSLQNKSLDKHTVVTLQGEAAKAGLVVLGERSAIQPGPLFERHTIHRTRTERSQTLRRIQETALHMELFREGLLIPVKNPTKDCHWDCEFKDVCELHERGGNWEDLLQIGFRREDPYADHRKSTDE